METMYVYEVTRHSFESYLSRCTSSETLRHWNLLLLHVWIRYATTDEQRTRNHWMKLWMDHMARLSVHHAVAVEWRDVHDQLVMYPNVLVRF